MKRLQSVQNAAARLVSGARRRDHITPAVLCSLHWLPVRRGIFFKTAVLVWKCIHDVAPAYLQEVCLPVESVPGRPRLRSASTIKSVDVNRSAELQLPRSHSLEQPAVCSPRRQSFTEHVLAAAEDLSVLDSNAHHPAPLRRFVTLAPSINVMTYLLTYLIKKHCFCAYKTCCCSLHAMLSTETAKGGKHKPVGK